MSEDGERDEAMLTVKEVGEFFGGKHRPLNKSTVWTWVRKGKLAKPVYVSDNVVRWRLSDCKRLRDEMFAKIGKERA